MRRLACLAVVSILLAGSNLARAAECANPDALGTARVIAVDPREHARIGTMQYDESLPLADREVVLTFDDGPVPPYSQRVLEALAAECVRATYFVVGQQARAHAELVRQAHEAGHTIGTHTESHPYRFDLAEPETITREIDAGLASAAAALGDRDAVAPFFRFPGLRRSAFAEGALAARGLMAWSADMPADDWMRISADTIVARALERLEQRGRGVLLLHDIQPATALALPGLLRELKARGFKVVHVVPADGAQPKTATVAAQWRGAARARARLASRLPIASPDSFGWPRPYRLDLDASAAAPEDETKRPAFAAAELPEFPEIAAPNPEIAGRYGLAQPEPSALVVARSDEALGSMSRRPRPRPMARPDPEPKEPPMLFGGLLRLPFLSPTH